MDDLDEVTKGDNEPCKKSSIVYTPSDIKVRIFGKELKGWDNMCIYCLNCSKDEEDTNC